MLRRAAWAGQFYPGDPSALRAELQHLLAGAPSKEIAAPIGCVSPHAGYMYSGAIAGAVYRRLELPERFIILCPNHTGRGGSLAIMGEGSWQTPLGDAPVDSALAARIMKHCPLLSEDSEAHEEEHSLEVQLPFLQFLKPGFSFVPIAIGLDRFADLEFLGHSLARAVQESEPRPLIIASSDMNHFETDERTRIKDRRAIDRILALDPRGLYDTVRRDSISMCGYAPATAMLTAALDLGAQRAELVRYGTSADVTGDTSRVVGYAGIAVW
jgi:AmmeMemoRadiSam system protein B